MWLTRPLQERSTQLFLGILFAALLLVTVLHLALPGCEVVDVLSKSSHGDEIERLSSADGTILIAPEFDDILLNTAKRVARAGGTLGGISSGQPLRVSIAPRRTLHLRFNDLGVPFDTDFASVIESDVPIVVQHTRLDSRQAELALLSTVAYGDD